MAILNECEHCGKSFGPMVHRMGWACGECAIEGFTLNSIDGLDDYLYEMALCANGDEYELRGDTEQYRALCAWVLQIEKAAQERIRANPDTDPATRALFDC